MNFLIRVPGSCGELAQGRIGGLRLHISCPVNRYAWGGFGAFRSVQHPVGAKVKKLLHLAEARRDRKKIPFTLYSELPVGKGMASSTADLAAALALHQWRSGSSLNIPRMVELLLAVEPTDGVLFEGITLFDHFRGTLQKPLGLPPPMDIIALEFEERIDTVGFNERDQKKAARAQEAAVLKSFQLIEKGLQEGSTWKIGEGATLSALSHQNILPKPDLERILKLTLELGGVGVNIAHSGSMIGMLFNPGSYDFHSLAERIVKILHRMIPVHRLQIRGGGIEWMNGNLKAPS